MATKPLREREGFAELPDHPITKELRALIESHGYIGAVLITFDAKDERVGITNAGIGDFGKAMSDLADKVALAIDDGMFDPSEEGEKPN